MAFDGNGNWVSNFSAEADRDAGYKILASRFDNIFIADIASSFENCLTKDAQVKPIQAFDVNNNKIINLANPTNNNDAVNLTTLNSKDSTAVHKTGTETISGNKTMSGSTTISGASTISGNITSSGTNTWSGSNTFSGSVSLGSSATATTPAYSDNDTSVATTAMVHNLNDTQRTNCLTEIPQDIKLELNSGTLTLKAGSKVYVPNGSGVFDVVTTSSDITFTQNSALGKNFLYVNSSGTVLSRHNNVASGSSVPANFSGTFYNTTTNKIQYYSSGTPSTNYYSLPIAVFTIGTDQTANVTSIDQVFNGIGYIGSTIFALPGVKGLIPNGRNADGTLKSNSFAYTSVKTETRSDYGNNVRAIKLNGSSISAAAITNVQYDSASNLNIESGTPRNVIYGGILTTVDSATQSIVSLDSTPVFHAVDYADVVLKNGPNNFYRQNSFYNLSTFFGNVIYENGPLNAKIIRDSSSPAIAEIQTAKSDGTRTGGFRNSSDNHNTTRMYVTNDDGTQILGYISVITDGTNVYTYAPTPSSATDCSTKIATTEWFANYMANATNKSNIVSLGMPDYSAGVSKTANTAFQADKNYIGAFGGGTGDHQLQTSTSQNGTYTTIAQVYQGGGTFSMSIPVFLTKGRWYKFTSGSLTIYPCNGG